MESFLAPEKVLTLVQRWAVLQRVLLTSLGIVDFLRYFRAVFPLIPDFNAAAPNDMPRDNNFLKHRAWRSSIIGNPLLGMDCEFLPRRLACPDKRCL
jgi:hypothetical protein